MAPGCLLYHVPLSSFLYPLVSYWPLVRMGVAHRTEAVEKRFGVTEGKEGKVGVGMVRE